MKPATLAARLRPLLPLLRCPRCGRPFSLTDSSLLCQQGHCYDLSRRGYVNLAPGHDQAAEKYDAALFESRAQVLEAGFYAPVADAVSQQLQDRFGASAFTLLDVGCGEGYYTRCLARRFPAARLLGLDISRDAVTLAARQCPGPAWLVADLKRLPVADGTADVVLDVLTPADYAQFAQALSPQGVLIKVVPGVDYLREIRRAVAPYLRSGEEYSSQRVLDHLQAHGDVLNHQEIRVAYPLTPALSSAFLRMTPMTFSVPREALEAIQLEAVTLHMHVLCCRVRA